MNPAAAVVCGGGLALLALLFTGRRELSPSGDSQAGHRKAAPKKLGIVAGPALVGVASGAWLHAWGVGASLGLVAGLCAAVWVTGRRVRQAAGLAESVASLATVLANQATAATTVIEAVRGAAPLVSGPVRDATLQMATDCELLGVSAATTRFKRRLPVHSAQWLGDIVDISAAGGGRWVDVAHIFETEAGEEAEMLRYLVRKVGTQLPTLVAVMMLSAGIVAGLGWMSADVGSWLLGAQGQMAVGVASATVALFVGRTLSAVGMMLR